MKKVLQSICIIGSLIALSSAPATAQCIPDYNITTPGIYPDSATGLPPGMAGIYYSTDIQLKVPHDTTITNPFPLTIPINHIQLNNITGLPPGLSYACNPGTCIFEKDSNGCVLLSGTPTTAGSYPLNVDITIQLQILGQPVDTPLNFNYYTIVIDPLGVNDIASKGFSLEQNKPNPFSGITEISYYTSRANEVEFKIFNLLGKEILKKKYYSVPGRNIIRLDAKEFNSGIYMYTLQNGETTLTRRMVINKK